MDDYEELEDWNKDDFKRGRKGRALPYAVYPEVLGKKKIQRSEKKEEDKWRKKLKSHLINIYFTSSFNFRVTYEAKI